MPQLTQSCNSKLLYKSCGPAGKLESQQRSSEARRAAPVAQSCPCQEAPEPAAGSQGRAQQQGWGQACSATAEVGHALRGWDHACRHLGVACSTCAQGTGRFVLGLWLGNVYNSEVLTGVTVHVCGITLPKALPKGEEEGETWGVRALHSNAPSWRPKLTSLSEAQSACNVTDNCSF